MGIPLHLIRSYSDFVSIFRLLPFAETTVVVVIYLEESDGVGIDHCTAVVIELESCCSMRDGRVTERKLSKGLLTMMGAYRQLACASGYIRS